MGLAGVCARCAWNYCGVLDPDCPRCLGSGRVDGGDREGVDPLVVLRAALMALDAGVDRKRLHELGLLGEPGSGRPQPARATLTSERSVIGRAAGALLRDLRLRKTPKTRSPEERADRKRQREAKKERDRLMVERIDRDRQERANQHRRREVERRALAEVAARHPDEMAEEVETQEVFVALIDGFGSYMPPAARRALGDHG